MATTQTSKAGWQDYAILSPSIPKVDKHGKPVAWKVQRNDAGLFRCSCPSFIFQRAPIEQKECKHTRACKLDANGGTSVVTTTTTVTKATVKPTVAQAVPALTHATAIQMFDAMCAAVTHTNVKGTLGATACHAMTTVLAQHLAKALATTTAPIPTLAKVVAAQATVGTIRHITFED